MTEDTHAFRGTLGAKVHICAPADPEAKGLMERANGYLETSFLPGRSFASPADFNTQLTCWLALANGRAKRVLGCAPTARIEADRAAMLALPPAAPSTGWRSSLRLPRDHYVCLDANDYSVHPAVIGRRVEVIAGLDRVQVLCDGRVVADHQRCWARHQSIHDPRCRGWPSGPAARLVARRVPGRLPATRGRRPGVPRRRGSDPRGPVPRPQVAGGVRLRPRPRPERDTIAHLGTLDFVTARDNVVFLGPPGTGKTHLAIGLAIRACQAGHRVLFATASKWVARLAEARRQGVNFRPSLTRRTRAGFPGWETSVLHVAASSLGVASDAQPSAHSPSLGKGLSMPAARPAAGELAGRELGRWPTQIPSAASGSSHRNAETASGKPRVRARTMASRRSAAIVADVAPAELRTHFDCSRARWPMPTRRAAARPLLYFAGSARTWPHAPGSAEPDRIARLTGR